MKPDLRPKGEKPYLVSEFSRMVIITEGDRAFLQIPQNRVSDALPTTTEIDKDYDKIYPPGAL